MAKKQMETLERPTNGAEPAIAAPYTVSVTIQGQAALLFHGWNNESVEEKGRAAKGSKAKKTDDVESYVYRDEEGEIALPGEYLRMSVVSAAKYIQDPRSPRKSAKDLFKAGLVCMTPLASLGSKDWDYLDRRRVMVQRNAITRQRPAFNAGWTATVQLLVLLPEYIPQDLLLATLNSAGKLEGVGDFRPTFGRFQVTHYEVLSRL
jgi:hypothetical protein